MGRRATSPSWPGASSASSRTRRSPIVRRCWRSRRAPSGGERSSRSAGCRCFCWTCRSPARRSARSCGRSPRSRRRCWRPSRPGTTRRWRRSGPSARAERRDDPAGAEGDLSRARHFLFAEAAPPARPPAATSCSSRRPAKGGRPSRSRDASSMRRASGTPFDQMAILLRAPEIYGSLLDVALQRAGIPAFFARGTLAARSGRARVPGAARLRASRGSRRDGSPSISRSARCRRWTRPARRRRIARRGWRLTTRASGLAPRARCPRRQARPMPAGRRRRRR